MNALNSHNIVLFLALLCVHAASKPIPKDDTQESIRRDPPVNVGDAAPTQSDETKKITRHPSARKSNVARPIPDKNTCDDKDNVGNETKKDVVPVVVSLYRENSSLEWNPVRSKSLPMVTCSYVDHRSSRMSYDDFDKEEPRPNVGVFPKEEEIAVPEMFSPVDDEDEVDDVVLHEIIDEIPELVDLIARAPAVPVAPMEPVLVDLLMHNPLVVDNEPDNYQAILDKSNTTNDLWPSYENDLLLTHDMVKSEEYSPDRLRGLVDEMANPMSIAATSLYMTYYVMRNMARGIYDWCFSDYSRPVKPVVPVDDIW